MFSRDYNQNFCLRFYFLSTVLFLNTFIIYILQYGTVFYIKQILIWISDAKISEEIILSF